MNKVYATAYQSSIQQWNKNNDSLDIWTISEDPNKEGWETDSGCDGYGLPKEKAEFYAKCINYCIENKVFD